MAFNKFLAKFAYIRILYKVDNNTVDNNIKVAGIGLFFACCCDG